jgi:PhzF family phenazine biosynthesis protein
VLDVVVSFLRHLFGWRFRARRPDVVPPPDRPLVVVFNHTSNVDAFAVAHTVWRGLGHWCQPLAKAEIFEMPVVGDLARGAGAIPVRRGEDTAREAAYGDAVARLEEGGTILVAPEGTTTHDGSLLPLRHGAARLALEAGVDVLVVTHFGAQRGFSPVVRWPERDVLVTLALDVLSPWPGEDAAALTGRIAATLRDRTAQLQAAYPQADPDAAWWPPYSRPASPTETARENLERYRDSMAEAVAHARERMARFAEDHERVGRARDRVVRFAEDHEVEQRLAEARHRVSRFAEDHEVDQRLAEARARVEGLQDRARQRVEELGDRARALRAGDDAVDLEVLRYTAFTTDPSGGNPAGVVLAAALPSEEVMQRVATEVGFSETAFLAPRPDGDGHDVRYFSPTREVTFCGHATIAAGVALAERDPDLAHVTMYTRTDVVPVAIGRGGDALTATLTSPPARHESLVDDRLDELLACFGWDRGVLADDLAPAVAFAGAWHPVLPLRSRELLAATDADFEVLRDLMLREDWTTIAVVWREAPDRVHARNPFAGGGVVEDPATSAAAAAFAGLLRDRGGLPESGRLTITQGEDMGRPSRLDVDALAAAPSVRVGGPAVPIP